MQEKPRCSALALAAGIRPPVDKDYTLAHVDIQTGNGHLEPDP